MALPTDSSDSFLREVDENLRRDRAQDFAKRYGKWIALAVILFLAAVAGYLYWQDRQRAKSAEQSEELSKIFTDIGAERSGNVPQRLDKLSSEGGDVVRSTALYLRSALALEQNDRKLALSKYREISGDDGLPQPYRDLALIRATALEFDSLKPADVVARMQPLAVAGNPWFGSAGELTAMAHLKQGKKAEAGKLFAAIAADRQVPQTIRSRAAQIAGTLGVDASASLETLSL